MSLRQVFVEFTGCLNYLDFLIQANKRRISFIRKTTCTHPVMFFYPSPENALCNRASKFANQHWL
jgi:hypothetical protein